MMLKGKNRAVLLALSFALCGGLFFLFASHEPGEPKVAIEVRPMAATNAFPLVVTKVRIKNEGEGVVSGGYANFRVHKDSAPNEVLTSLRISTCSLPPAYTRRLAPGQEVEFTVEMPRPKHPWSLEFGCQVDSLEIRLAQWLVSSPLGRVVPTPLIDWLYRQGTTRQFIATSATIFADLPSRASMSK